MFLILFCSSFKVSGLTLMSLIHFEVIFKMVKSTSVISEIAILWVFKCDLFHPVFLSTLSTLTGTLLQFGEFGLIDNYLWASRTPACLLGKGITHLCSGLSIQICSYGEQHWKTEMMSTFRAYRIGMISVQCNEVNVCLWGKVQAGSLCIIEESCSVSMFGVFLPITQWTMCIVLMTCFVLTMRTRGWGTSRRSVDNLTLPRWVINCLLSLTQEPDVLCQDPCNYQTNLLLCSYCKVSDPLLFLRAGCLP
jgi:hypothetical protein